VPEGDSLRKRGAEHLTNESELPLSRKFVALRSKLHEHNAIDSLKALVTSGCDEACLLPILDLIRQDWPGLDTSVKKTGLSRKQLKASIRRFREVADTIEGINHKTFGLLLLPPSGLAKLRDLPGMLRIYADMLERPVAVLGSVRYPALHAWKFYLTHHVIGITSHPHDKEVAELIDAVLPEAKRSEDRKQGGAKLYDANAQKQWRRSHYRRTEEVLAEARKKAPK
jgi:hypothetical protein